jgi:hypothetical protein
MDRATTSKEGRRQLPGDVPGGGRESAPRYGGAFSTKREALIRKQWVAGELAAARIPDLRLLAAEAPKAPTLADAAEAWRTSRVDVAAQTGKIHRSDVARIFRVAPKLRTKRIDQLEVADVAVIVAALTEARYKRETISKSRDALAMTLDFYDVKPNPARDKRVKLPKERRPHVPPPLAEHVERIAEVLPRRHVLPLLVIDECGPE